MGSNSEFARKLLHSTCDYCVRKSKIVILPTGEKIEVLFNYERIQKRCYNCQRLNHEKDHCPILIKQRQDRDKEYREKHQGIGVLVAPVLPTDPLFGVLFDHQIGFHQARGKAKIADEVLDEMRVYFVVPLKRNVQSGKSG